MDKFKENSIKQTVEVVDNLYDIWIYSDKTEVLSDTISFAFKSDTMGCNIVEKRNYWMQKFSNEISIVEKLLEM